MRHGFGCDTDGPTGTIRYRDGLVAANDRAHGGSCGTCGSLVEGSCNPRGGPRIAAYRGMQPVRWRLFESRPAQLCARPDRGRGTMRATVETSRRARIYRHRTTLPLGDGALRSAA